MELTFLGQYRKHMHDFLSDWNLMVPSERKWRDKGENLGSGQRYDNMAQVGGVKNKNFVMGT